MTYWVKRPKKFGSSDRVVHFPPTEWLIKLQHPQQYSDLQWVYYRDTFITNNAIRWLRATRGRQFFLFVNYMDVHQPNGRPPNEIIPLEDEEGSDKTKFELISDYEGKPVPVALRNHLINQYDRELVHLDREVSRLLQYVEDAGLSESTTVLLTSDHGEYLGEHGLFGHSAHLHNEVINVPLVVKAPGRTLRRFESAVHSVDLFYTIAEFLKIGDHTDRKRGTVFNDVILDVVAEWYSAQTTAYRSPQFNGRFDRDLRAILVDHWKLFEDEHGNVELYDLSLDAAEQVDLGRLRTAEVEKLRTRMQAWLKANPQAERVETSNDGKALTPEGMRRLRSLGYVQ